MWFIKQFISRLNNQRLIKKNLKANGFNYKQFEKDMKDWQNRNLNIEEILSRDFSENVIVDAYEYYMRKCNWNPELINCPCVKDYLLCVLFIGEVDNGGVSQFLFNSSGDLTFETIEALQRIDEGYAEALISATQCFPGGMVPKDLETRNKIMDAFDDDTRKKLEELDNCLIGRDISQKLYDFIHMHEMDFLKN